MKARCLLLVFSVCGFCLGETPAADLARIDRTIKKEPAYKAKPRYCLVALDAEARTRIWLVLDGETFYVDKTGSGDLTKAESVKPHQVLLTGLLRPGEKEPRALSYPCVVTKDI